jgi:hypothetical protein
MKSGIKLGRVKELIVTQLYIFVTLFTGFISYNRVIKYALSYQYSYTPKQRSVEKQVVKITWHTEYPQ